MEMETFAKMKVLWICNIMLPVVAEKLGREVSNREGWLTGLAEALKGKEQNLELGVAFPVDRELDGCRLEIDGMSCYGFYENTTDLERHDEGVGKRLRDILQDFEPDVVHCFGTEYDHALAAVTVWNPDKVLLGIQGVCGAISEAYFADLPETVIRRVTFRDWLKKDSLMQQKKKFELRAAREKETLRHAGQVTGRTTLDREYVQHINGRIVYHHMNETLRPVFYEGQWDPEKCEKHSIFVSQGDYPLKGLHYMLHAMPRILETYPDARLYVAGISIVNWSSLKDKIKICSYGKYLRELIARYDLQEKVIFTGKLSAQEMKERMLQSHLFACTSAMENSPNSLGEAMLLGMPCVAAAVGGVPDLFTDGQDGILYPGYGAAEYAGCRKAGDQTAEKACRNTGAQDVAVSAEIAQADRLAGAVLAMWGDEQRMLSCCAGARSHARVTHNGTENVDRLMEIYRQLAEN